MSKLSKITEEKALEELTAFVNHYSLETKTQEEVKEDMKVALLAIQNGNLVIDSELKPVLTLKDPLKNEDGGIVMDKIEFLTRVFPKDHIKLSKGLNLQKDQMEYMQKCISHLCKLPTSSYLDKFSKFDYTVMQQICTVFM